MTRRRRIIALAGLSGAGKSTLVHVVSQRMAFAHLSASALLKEWAARSGELPSSETLRLGDIDANQQMLIQAFNEKANLVIGDIIFDCHTVIDTPSELQLIPSSVFAAIGITDIAFLSVHAEELTKRRAHDVARPRPFRTADDLTDQQDVAITVARQIAQVIGATFVDIGAAPEDGIASLLSAERTGDGL